jgi:hypothetical protein
VLVEHLQLQSMVLHSKQLVEEELLLPHLEMVVVLHTMFKQDLMEAQEQLMEAQVTQVLL